MYGWNRPDANLTSPLIMKAPVLMSILELLVVVTPFTTKVESAPVCHPL
jgi:hypothetical protein